MMRVNLCSYLLLMHETVDVCNTLKYDGWEAMPDKPNYEVKYNRPDLAMQIIVVQ